MPQTLLALFALMLTSTFALQQSRHTLHTEMNMVRQEATTQARGVASEVFAEVANLAFDEVTHTAEGTVSVTDLTPEPFEEGKLFSDATDVDDVHRMVPHLVTRTVARPDGTFSTLTFAVTATVDYAVIQSEGGEEVMAPTADNARTYTKLVTLHVRCLDLDNAGWGNATLLTLARPFAYSPSRS
jgi:hypothetical protein